jgi:hypothetical protein
MSQQQQLTPDDAYNVLVSQVHAPVFFEKLARVYGVQPQSPDEARELLLIAGQLRNADDQQAVKQASQRENFYASARQDLSRAMAANGLAPIQHDGLAVKQAAQQAAQNPLIEEAAMVFSRHLNKVMAQNG